MMSVGTLNRRFPVVQTKEKKKHGSKDVKKITQRGKLLHDVPLSHTVPHSTALAARLSQLLWQLNRQASLTEKQNLRLSLQNKIRFGFNITIYSRKC